METYICPICNIILYVPQKAEIDINKTEGVGYIESGRVWVKH